MTDEKRIEMTIDEHDRLDAVENQIIFMNERLSTMSEHVSTQYKMVTDLGATIVNIGQSLIILLDAIDGDDERTEKMEVSS